MPITLDGTLGITTPALTVTGATVNTGGISTAGNLTFTSTGNRITGDFSNATNSNRVAFQTSTTNSVTSVGAIPNGTSVNSGFRVYGSSDTNNTSIGQLLQNGSSETQLRSDISGTGTYAPLAIFTGGSERMRIDTSGNVGIGTTTPLASYNAALAVVSANTFGTITAKCTATTGAAGVFVQNDANTADCFMYAFNSASGSLNAAVGTSKAQSLVFYTNNSAKVYITSAGNVGIGVTSPTYNLEVSGNTKTTGYYSVNDVGYVRSSSGLLEFQGGSTATRFMDSSYSAELMRITQAGNVGIGTSSPSEKLHIKSGTYPTIRLEGGTSYGGIISFQGSDGVQNATITSYSTASGSQSNCIFFGTNTSTNTGVVERMRIDYNGYVGIGTNAPANLLEVSSGVDTQVRITTTSTGKVPVINFNNSGGSVTSRVGQETSAGNAAFVGSTAYDLCIYAATSKGVSIGNAGALLGQFDSSANFKMNSGYGSVATAYGCRAWATLTIPSNGGAVTIAAGGNIASITHTAAGAYFVSFTNAMPDINYSVNINASMTLNNSSVPVVQLFANNSISNYTAPTTAGFYFIIVHDANNVLQDSGRICISVFR